MSRKHHPRRRRKSSVPRPLQPDPVRTSQVIPLRAVSDESSGHEEQEADGGAPEADGEQAVGVARARAVAATDARHEADGPACAAQVPARHTPAHPAPAHADVGAMVRAFELALDEAGQDARVQDAFFQRGLDERALAAHRNNDEQGPVAHQPWNRSALYLGAGGLALVLALITWALVSGQREAVPPAPPAPLAPVNPAPVPVTPPPALVPPDEPARPAPTVEADPAEGALPALATDEVAASEPLTTGSEPAPAGLLSVEDRLACDAAYRKRRYRAVVDRCTAVLGDPSAGPLAPADVVLASQVAHALLMTGDNQAAGDAAARILETAPGFALAHLVLGMAEQERGQRERARTAYERYLELEPHGEHAKDLRAILKRL